MTEYFNLIKSIDYSVVKMLSFALKFHIGVNL